MQITMFDVFNKMGEEDKDITGFNLADNLIEVERGKDDFGKITIAIDNETVDRVHKELITGGADIGGMLFMFGLKDFKKAKEELEKNREELEEEMELLRAKNKSLAEDRETVYKFFKEDK